jgi:hypothetical protein
MEPFPDDHKEWHVHLMPGPVDLDLFDFPDVAGNLVEAALTDAIMALLPPGFVRNLVLALVGGIAELIRTVLDIPDDIEEWLSDLFNISFGLLDIMAQGAGAFFGCRPVYRIDDPYPLLEAEGEGDAARIAVKVPIQNLGVVVNDDELVITADLGA